MERWPRMQWLLRGIRPWKTSAGEGPCKLVLDFGDGILVEGHYDRLTNGGRAVPRSNLLEQRAATSMQLRQQEQDRSQAPRERAPLRDQGTGRRNGALVHKRHGSSRFEARSAHRRRTLRCRQGETVQVDNNDGEGAVGSLSFQCLQGEGFSLCGGCVDQSNTTPDRPRGRGSTPQTPEKKKIPQILWGCTRGSSDCQV